MQSRTLKRELSNSDDVAAEDIARTIKRLFDVKKYNSSDATNTESVTFWVGSMVSHIKMLKEKFQGSDQEFVAGLDSYTAHFFKYVCTRLR